MKTRLLRSLCAMSFPMFCMGETLANPILVKEDRIVEDRIPVVVTFNANGGMIENHRVGHTVLKKDYGDYWDFRSDCAKGRLPRPVRRDRGYVFDGWYSKSIGGIPAQIMEIPARRWYRQTPEIVVYAHWHRPWRQGDFTGKLYRQLAKGDGNLVFSPYGVGSVCALMATGAKGDTLEAFVKTLGLPTKDPDEIAQIFGGEKRQLANTVELTDSIWLFRGFSPYDTFRSRAVDVFLAEARETSGGAAAKREINDFVKEKTHGKIPQLLQSPPPKDTAMAAVNTVYLNATWACPFNVNMTRPSQFKTLTGKSVDVVYMSGRFENAKVGFYKTKNLAVLSLPYGNCNLQMLFLLPDEDVKLSRVESLLSESYIAEIVRSIRESYRIDVRIPKFEFEARHYLVKALCDIGLDVAFDLTHADFSGLASRRLWVSDAQQVAKIKTDERGTEAAAATAIVLQEGSPHYYLPPSFIANRPFIFLLRDKKTGSIFFVGRVTDPSRK